MVEEVLNISAMTAVLTGVFLISVLGYLLGRVEIKKVSLGTAGVFLVALLFGYLFSLKGLEGVEGLNKFYIAGSAATSYKYYTLVKNVGLLLFVTSVGFIAGPTFFRNFKSNALSFIVLGVVIVVVGSALCASFAAIPGIGSEFSAGVFSGALTSTPGYAAAEGAAENPALVSLGLAIAYPFGVVGVVLFVQLVPKLLKADMAAEREKMRASLHAEVKLQEDKPLFEIDKFGLAPFGVAVLLGIFVGSITIPLSSGLYNGPTFSLGNTGGPLIMALVLGHFGRVGKLSLRVPDKTLKVFREFGLMLFLIGSGVEGGVNLVSQVSASQYGGMLVLYGFLAGLLMTLVPMIIGFLFARKVLKLPLFNALGSICGGMTSTPALGTLIHVTESEEVGGAYAATYPIALVLVVLASQLIVVLI